MIRHLPADVQSALRVESKSTALSLAQKLVDRDPSQPARLMALAATFSAVLGMKPLDETVDAFRALLTTIRHDPAAATTPAEDALVARLYGPSNPALPARADATMAQLRAEALTTALPIHTLREHDAAGISSDKED